MFYRRKLFYRIARIAAMFFIGLIAAVLVALSQVNLETLRGDLIAALRGATGLPIEIDGDISWKFSLRPKVELNKVRIPNAPWAENKDGFAADKIDVTLNLISLLQRRPTIQSVKISNAALFIERNSAGELSIAQNIVKEEQKPADEEKDQNVFPFQNPGLGSIEVHDLAVRFDGRAYSLDGFQIKFRHGKDTREYSGWIQADSTLYPFIVSFSKYNEERKVFPVRAALSTGADPLVADIALEGTSLMPIDFIVKGSIADAASLGKILNLDLPDLSTIKINLAGGFGHESLTLRKSSIALKNTEFGILSANIDWSGKIPVIAAKIKSDKIDLYDLFPELYLPGVKWVRPNRDLNVFKNVPLFGTELLDRNVNIEADVGTLRIYRDLTVKDIHLAAKLKDAKLRTDVSANFAGGPFTGAAEIAADDSGTLDVRAAGRGNQIYAGEIMSSLREPDFISELPANFEFYLTGRGATLSELMSTVTGPIFIYSADPGYAHSELVSFVYGTDFLTDLRHGIQDLFSSEKKTNQITISCAAINLKARSGRIETDNGIALETNAVNVRLTGSVDLGQETLKASLITVPSRGLKISLTGGLVNSMAFTGNLAEPEVKISGSAVVSKVASATGIGLLLAPLTGGISLVAGAGIGLVAGDFLENWLSDQHPCRTALEHGAPGKPGDPDWMNRPLSELVDGMIKG